MMRDMRSRFQAILLPLALAVVMSTSIAAADDGDEVRPDARVEGYSRGTGSPAPLVINPSSGTSSTWMLAAIVGAACMGAMCKNGKRTHLD